MLPELNVKLPLVQQSSDGYGTQLPFAVKAAPLILHPIGCRNNTVFAVHIGFTTTVLVTSAGYVVRCMKYPVVANVLVTLPAEVKVVVVKLLMTGESIVGLALVNIFAPVISPIISPQTPFLTSIPSFSTTAPCNTMRSVALVALAYTSTVTGVFGLITSTGSSKKNSILSVRLAS